MPKVGRPMRAGNREPGRVGEAGGQADGALGDGFGQGDGQGEGAGLIGTVSGPER